MLQPTNTTEYTKWKNTLNDTTDEKYWSNFILYAVDIFDDIALNTQAVVSPQLNISQQKLSMLMGILREFKRQSTNCQKES